MNEDKIIVTENLTKNYSGFVALDNLNLQIEKNSCVGFLGPNGAGKSTAIKILTGLIRPTHGTAHISGIDVVKKPRQALANIGAIVESPEFYPYLNPEEILSYMGKIRGISKNDLPNRIDAVLELVKLEQWKAQKIGKFSKGMKQRVCLASALLHEPSVLILDEPTSGLDPRGAKEVQDIIHSLKEKGKTVFMSTHILSEVQSVCDTIALIDKGKLLQFEKLSQVKKSSQGTYIEVQTLHSITEKQLVLITNLQGVESIRRQEDYIFFVKFNGDVEDRAHLLKKMQEEGIDIVSFRTIESDLESLYMELVSESVR